MPKKLTQPTLSMSRTGFKVTYPAKHGVSDYIEIDVEQDGTLSVRGHDGRIVVRPEVANKINIALEKF